MMVLSVCVRASLKMFWSALARWPGIGDVMVVDGTRDMSNRLTSTESSLPGAVPRSLVRSNPGMLMGLSVNNRPR